MRILALGADTTAIADADGAQREIDISLLESPSVGDYVIVHAGFAIETLDEAEAKARIDLFAQFAGNAAAPHEET